LLEGGVASLKEYLTHARTFRVTIDREVELPMGSALCSTARTGNGFVVRGCNFGFNRSRGILVKGSDGLIEGNTLVGNVMAAIMVAPEWWWLESGSSNHVKILDNTIRDCGDVAIAVYAFGGAPGVAPAGAHNDLTISGNTITGCPLPNILVTSTKGLTLLPNTFLAYEGKTTSEWTRWRFGLMDKKLEPVMTINCTDVQWWEVEVGF
ncbi:MAG: right-handed parallel beta-helix repeat-containing protein, partial [Armatimonadota bacterium]